MRLVQQGLGWKARVFALLAVAALAWAIRWWQRQSLPRPALLVSAPSNNTIARQWQVPGATAHAPAVGDALRRQITALRAAGSPEQIRSLLAGMRRQLASLPAEAASKAIRELLDASQDVPTQLKFGVGVDGFLTEAPSLRTFLLDQLARVDPAGAAAYAQTILSAMNSPDEWAVALRNYALGNRAPEGRSFLEQKMRGLLGYEPWQKEPTAGYLEAFDVAVYLGGTNLMPALAALVQKTDNQALAHAAFLALDRLTLADPVATLNKLQSDPGLMQGREVTRANYFARADAGDAQQRTLLESYLLSPQLSGAELTTFAGLYPNANYMVSYNLLTRTLTPDHETLMRRDRDALQVVEGWMADTRFQKLQPQLQTIKNRLETFVKQAGR